MKRSAFTLVEMLISVVILSLIFIFLYNTLSNLKLSNNFFEKKVNELSFEEELHKTIYLDLSMANKNSIQIINVSKEFDVLSFQTPHSLHQRINPYVAYITTEDEVLYRIESHKPFVYPIKDLPRNVLIDEISKVKNFRIYKNSDLLLIDYRKELDKINPFQVKVYN